MLSQLGNVRWTFLERRQLDIDHVNTIVKVLSEAAIGHGVPGIVHGSTSFLLQDDHGQVQEAKSISAGLDYPGVGPEHAYLADIGRARYEPVTDEEVVEAFQLLARTEGIIPALESAHALAWVVRAKDELAGKTVLLNLSGRGDKDVAQIADLLGEDV